MNNFNKARVLYENFTGHDGEEIGVLPKPEVPDTLAVIGFIDGIMYSSVRAGKLEHYVHEFDKDSRPLFCVSPDGKNIHLIGGSYDFTERGIIDRKPKRR